MGEIIEALQAVSDFFTEDIFAFADSVFVQISTWIVTWTYKMKIALIGVSWGVAENIMTNLNLSALIDESWSAIDDQTMGYITFFRLPEAFNVLIQAVIARYSLNVINGLI